MAAIALGRSADVCWLLPYLKHLPVAQVMMGFVVIHHTVCTVGGICDSQTCWTHFLFVISLY
jgi:hypothetical protein